MSKDAVELGAMVAHLASDDWARRTKAPAFYKLHGAARSAIRMHAAARLHSHARIHLFPPNGSLGKDMHNNTPSFFFAISQKCTQ
jgi:hypothetical protein